MKTSAATFARLASSRAWARHLADLRLAAAHPDAAHELGEPLPARDEIRRPALAEAAEVDELHIEAAKSRRGLEHPGLQGLREIPGRLAAHRRIERENEPSARPLAWRRDPPGGLDEVRHLVALAARGERQILVLVHADLIGPESSSH